MCGLCVCLAVLPLVMCVLMFGASYFSLSVRTYSTPLLRDVFSYMSLSYVRCTPSFGLLLRVCGVWLCPRLCFEHLFLVARAHTHTHTYSTDSMFDICQRDSFVQSFFLLFQVTFHACVLCSWQFYRYSSWASPAHHFKLPC